MSLAMTWGDPGVRAGQTGVTRRATCDVCGSPFTYKGK